MAEWFGPKRHGLGARPITWQGWALTVVYVGGMILATQFFARNAWALGSIIVTATAFYIVIVMRTTRGGFRWRWGDKK